MRVLLAVDSSVNIQSYGELLGKLRLPAVSELYLSHVVEFKHAGYFPVLKAHLNWEKDLIAVRTQLTASAQQYLDDAQGKLRNTLTVKAVPLVVSGRIPKVKSDAREVRLQTTSR